MNETCKTGFDEATQDRLLHRTRLILGVVWKVMTAALGVAILLGMVAGPSTRSDFAASVGPQPVQVTGEGNRYQVMTRVPSGEETIHLEIYDPAGKQHLKLTYSDRGPLFWIMPSDSLQVGYATRPMGDETFSFRTPVNHFNIEKYVDGKTGIVVMEDKGNRRSRYETWISPEGKVFQRSGADH